LKYGNGISEKITHNPTKYKNHEKIVSVDWLHEHLQDPELIILDAILETPIEDIQIKELEPLTSKPSLAILVRCPILYQTRKPLRQPAVKWAFTTAVKCGMILKEFIRAQGRGGF
jgi:hypothetical protein